MSVQIDSRGPRFVATITAIVLLVVLLLALNSYTNAALILYSVVFIVFAYAAIRGAQHHPLGLLFARVIRPRLRRTGQPEDSAPPTFAQGVGAVISGLGIALSLIGLPLALEISAALAFVAAFLNGVFGYCLGCQMYLLLRRAGLIKTA